MCGHSSLTQQVDVANDYRQHTISVSSQVNQTGRTNQKKRVLMKLHSHIYLADFTTTLLCKHLSY